MAPAPRLRSSAVGGEVPAPARSRRPEGVDLPRGWRRRAAPLRLGTTDGGEPQAVQPSAIFRRRPRQLDRGRGGERVGLGTGRRPGLTDSGQGHRGRPQGWPREGVRGCRRGARRGTVTPRRAPASGLGRARTVSTDSRRAASMKRNVHDHEVGEAAPSAAAMPSAGCRRSLGVDLVLGQPSVPGRSAPAWRSQATAGVGKRPIHGYRRRDERHQDRRRSTDLTRSSGPTTAKWPCVRRCPAAAPTTTARRRPAAHVAGRTPATATGW